jgi:uncharacterized damage-inducible protein DinB
MPLADALLPEFDHEVATTRKVLERVPADKFAWKPHPKSFSLGDLAAHLTEIAMWGQMTLDRSEIDMAGPSERKLPASTADLVSAFDTNAAATRASLTGKTDAELMAPWALKRGGTTIFSMPKAAVWRSFVMNHLVHHRAQLAVYLRMNDVPVPSIYGPSADEQTF